VVEINDQVIKATGLFTLWNNNCLKDPRSRIIEQDGRNHLELTRDKYDIIISVPSNPWMAGLANLFTLDYFETVKGRLNNNGIFVQWISAYDMDWDSFAMIGRTFAGAFPDGMLVNAMSMSDFLLVGFSNGKNLNLKVAEKNAAYAQVSKNISIRDPKVLYNLIVTEDLKEFFGPGHLHTDNMPRLEFIAPKNLGKNSGFIKARIKNSSRLSSGTKEIIESNKSIDSSLDNLEMMKIGSSPPFKDVDLNKATEAQLKRYNAILNDYCSNEDVSDYAIFPNSDLRKQCARIQVEKIREHMASNPEDGKAGYKLAQGLGAMGNVSAEIEALQKIISANPNYYNAYMELGQVLSSQGRLDEAAAQLSKALNINPDSAEAHNNIGNVYADLGRAGGAIEHFKKALHINPDSAETYNNLGSVFAGQGKNEDAVENFSKAISLVPDYAVAHDNLGRVLAGQGKIEEALAHFNEAVKITPESEDFHNDAGLAMGQLGQISASISQFAEALKINPNHFLANYNMGVALSGQGKVEEAIVYFLKATEIKPKDPETRKMLGMAMQSQSRFKEAAAQFAEVLKLEPDSAEAHDNLGVALAQMGQLNEAIGHFNKALEINSSFGTARNHLEIAQRALRKGQ
jgi:tetratricopeptide (TPR) repeat protein